MGLKEKIIKKLEKDVEYTAGTIDLETLNEEKREELFKKFGEGDKNLTEFLKIAYSHGAPSVFCCSGHGSRSPYVVLKVTDDNLEILRNLGKVLSKYDIATNFQEHHVRGKIVSFDTIKKDPSTEWLHIASQVLETPELYDSSNPEIYYHEEMHSAYKPFGFDLKKKLLHYLRGDKKQLPVGESKKSDEIKKVEHSCWELSDEERKNIKPIRINNKPNQAVKETTDIEK